VIPHGFREQADSILILVTGIMILLESGKSGCKDAVITGSLEP
jgi:hypothetical protein